jgi:urease accessory protein
LHGSQSVAESGPAWASAGPQAELLFTRAPDGRTYISHQRVGYPFHITRPFYLDSVPAGMLTLYLQSVSGGVYRGERLALSLEAEAHAEAQVTTQSATIVHRMKDGGEAYQEMTIRAGAGALLEYLPDPLILFPGARFHTALRVVAEPSATVVVCDAFTQHDSDSAGGRFERLASETRIERPDGSLLALDRFDIGGALDEAHFAGAGSVYPAHGTVMVVHTGCPAEELAGALNEALSECGGIYAGASTMPHECGAWARILAADGHALRAALKAVWTAARRKISGAEPARRPK